MFLGGYERYLFRWVPNISRYGLGSIGNGTSLCLLQVFQDRGVRSPDFCIFLPKIGVTVADVGLEVQYGTSLSYVETCMGSRSADMSGVFTSQISKARIMRYA